MAGVEKGTVFDAFDGGLGGGFFGGDYLERCWRGGGLGEVMTYDCSRNIE